MSEFGAKKILLLNVLSEIDVLGRPRPGPGPGRFRSKILENCGPIKILKTVVLRRPRLRPGRPRPPASYGN